MEIYSLLCVHNLGFNLNWSVKCCSFKIKFSSILLCVCIELSSSHFRFNGYWDWYFFLSFSLYSPSFEQCANIPIYKVFCFILPWISWLFWAHRRSFAAFILTFDHQYRKKHTKLCDTIEVINMRMLVRKFSSLHTFVSINIVEYMEWKRIFFFDKWFWIQHKIVLKLLLMFSFLFFSLFIIIIVIIFKSIIFARRFDIGM